MCRDERKPSVAPESNVGGHAQLPPLSVKSLPTYVHELIFYVRHDRKIIKKKKENIEENLSELNEPRGDA